MIAGQSADRALVIVAADLPPFPWRNGGGTTRQIADAPSTGHEFPTWRLSLATIATDGPFSAFHGVDRSLLLLSPTRLELDVDGSTTRLDRHDVADFAGEATVVARTDGQTGEALNLMTCRICGVGSWTLRDYEGTARLSRTDAVAMVLLSGSATVEDQQVQPHDTVVLTGTPTAVVFRTARLAAVELRPGSNAPGAG